MPVNRFKPNRFGMHQMHGNVAEWCEDLTQTRSIFGGLRNNRIVRGGSFYQTTSENRSASRSSMRQGARSPMVGFRPVWNLK